MIANKNNYDKINKIYFCPKSLFCLPCFAQVRYRELKLSQVADDMQQTIQNHNHELILKLVLMHEGNMTGSTQYLSIINLM